MVVVAAMMAMSADMLIEISHRKDDHADITIGVNVDRQVHSSFGSCLGPLLLRFVFFFPPLRRRFRGWGSLCHRLVLNVMYMVQSLNHCVKWRDDDEVLRRQVRFNSTYLRNRIINGGKTYSHGGAVEGLSMIRALGVIWRNLGVIWRNLELYGGIRRNPRKVEISITPWRYLGLSFLSQFDSSILFQY